MDIDQKLIEQFFLRDPVEAYRIVNKSNATAIAEIIDSVNPASAVKIIEQMDRRKAAQCIEKLDKEKVEPIITLLPGPIAALLFRQISSDISKDLLKSFSKELATSIQLSLNYAENTVGAWMDPGILAFSGDISAENALIRIKQDPAHYLSLIPLITQDQKYIGAVEIKNILTSGPKEKLFDLMEEQQTTVYAGLNIRSIFNSGIKLNLTGAILPVIDSEGLYLGMLDLNKINREIAPGIPDVNQERKTSQALGELYRIGLSGIFIGATEVITETKPKNYESGNS